MHLARALRRCPTSQTWSAGPLIVEGNGLHLRSSV